MDETPEGSPETSEEETPSAATPGAKRRLRLVVGGAVAFLLAAVITIALVFSSSKSGPECDQWLKAKADYLKGVPPIQQETASDSINFDGKVVVGGVTYVRPDSCK